METVIRTREIIALQNIDNCGPATVRKICNYLIRHGRSINGPQDLIDVFPYLRKEKVVSSRLDGFCREDAESAFRASDRILDSNERYGIQAVSIFDDRYPKALKDTINEKGSADAPILIYYKGDIAAAGLPSISIIGTREPTEIGIQAGKYFGKAFAEKGFNIASGLAIGCDTSGHEGALDGKGVTTAFLAHGLDTVFPQQNQDLAERIVGNGGVLISEYAVGTPVSKYSLVARDRLQAGIAKATIVIQTGISGGTMHAANTTLLAGKPLYVVKYADMTGEKTQGNLLLKEKGAQFITSSDVDRIAQTLSAGSYSHDLFKDTLF